MSMILCYNEIIDYFYGECMEEIEKKLPEYLIEQLKLQYNESEYKEILKGYSSKRKTTLRVNSIKSDYEKISESLRKNDIEFYNPDWNKSTFIIENADEAEIEKLDIYKNGEIYLQSLSSILPPIILNPKEGEDILDMAAAPGGKTTQIASITDNKANITACEMNKLRAEKLKYNIEKQGASSVNVMITDARRMDDFFSFDRILLDAPCSGSGTININDNKILFTKDFADKLEKTQTALLDKAINVLKKGHTMVYSTCSILTRENENIVNKFIKQGKIDIVPIQFNGVENIPQLPNKLNGTILVAPNELYEGFFVAKLIKK